MMMSSICATWSLCPARSNFPFARLGNPSIFPDSSSTLVSSSLSLLVSPLHLDQTPLRRLMMPMPFSAVRAMSSDHRPLQRKMAKKVYMEIKVREDGEQEAPHADIGIDTHSCDSDSNTARIEIELDCHGRPTIVQHFTLLCTNHTRDKKFSYKGSKFSRITKKVIQGGYLVTRITDDVGTRSPAEYPPYTITGSKEQVQVDRVEIGSVAMTARDNVNPCSEFTYGSEFTISTVQEPIGAVWKDIPVTDDGDDTVKQHKQEENDDGDGEFPAIPALRKNDLVFGKVSKGMDKLQKLIKLVADDNNPDGKLPNKDLVITDCGEIN